MNLEEVSVPVLLPHEILDAVARAGPYQARHGKRNQHVECKHVHIQFSLIGQKFEPLSVCNFDAWKSKPRCHSRILGALLDM